MRFILILAAAVLVILAGLFVYGQMLETDSKTIVEEVTINAS